MNIDITTADSRALGEPIRELLISKGPAETFFWLTDILNQQSPALRSSNSVLVAYTGVDEALTWLETSVASPVTHNWGDGAALLGATWVQIESWLLNGGTQQLMGLDALIAFRAPAENMAPFAQIAAPAMSDPPKLEILESRLNQVQNTRKTPRVQAAIEKIMSCREEILEPRERGVAVKDLPELFLNPDKFEDSSQIWEKHEKVTSGFRTALQRIRNRLMLH